jgi:hypothetical protein
MMIPDMRGKDKVFDYFGDLQKGIAGILYISSSIYIGVREYGGPGSAILLIN